MSKIKLILVVVVMTVLAGCGTPPKNMYYWGNYQDVLYKDFQRDNDSFEQLIDQLEKNIAQAEVENKPVAPGMHAQLGKLYLESGNKASGLAQLKREKELFPESGVFIDHLLKNIEDK